MFVQTRAILKKVKNTRCMPKIDIQLSTNVDVNLWEVRPGVGIHKYKAPGQICQGAEVVLGLEK